MKHSEIKSLAEWWEWTKPRAAVYALAIPITLVLFTIGFAIGGAIYQTINNP